MSTPDPRYSSSAHLAKTVALALTAWLAACAVTPYEKALEAQVAPSTCVGTRALWIVRDALTSPEAIGRILDAMQANDLNVALVQVRGRGDAYYESSVEPRADGLPDGFDPLAEVIAQAKPRGIAVHAWMNALFVADSKTRTFSRLSDHVVTKHPEWVLQDPQSRSMWDYDGDAWEKLLTSGAFLNAALPEVRAYTVSVVGDLLSKYDVAGIHLDYIRYPYSSWDEGKVQWGLDPQSLAPLSQVLDVPVAALLSNEAYHPVLDAYRRAQVTELVREVRELVRSDYPSKMLSIAAMASLKHVRQRVFQDWQRWLRDGLIDEAFLMTYNPAFDERVEPFYDPTLVGRYAFGIGVHQPIDRGYVTARIHAAKALGAAGVAFFRETWFLEHPADELRRDYGLDELTGCATRRVSAR